MASLRPLSVRQKLLLVIMLTTGMALLTAGVLFTVSDRDMARQGLVDQLRVLSQAVGSNCGPAILLRSGAAAEESLEAFRAQPQIEAACLYGLDGESVAVFRNEGPRGEFQPPPVGPNGHTFTEAGVSMFETVRLNGQPVGTLWVKSNLKLLEHRFEAFIKTMIVVVIVSVLVALIFASLIQRVVSQPILALSQAAQKVRKHRDYSVRVAGYGTDEVGRLAETFNEMIGAMEEHEDALETHADELEAKVAERTEALRRSMEEARSAAVAKSQFLANMSHEIRTPMNGVMGMTNILLGTELDEHQKEVAATVMDCANQLLRIINDILDFSKIEAGKLSLEVVDFDVHTVIEGAADLLHPMAQQKGLEMMCLVEQGLPANLRGDPGRLRQVVLNFLNNALKFTTKGEIVLTALVAEETDESVLMRVEVKDTGIGIPADRLGMLFQEFTQVDASTTRKFGGTGLGLAISKQLSEAMGGAVGVESVEGKGSTFWFTARLERQPERALAPLRLAPDFDELHVLVVDDNATNRQVIQHHLEAWGCWPVLVSSGEEAFAVLRENALTPRAFDLALIDLQMPEMSGDELAALIHRDDLLKDTPVIMLTTTYRARDVREFEQLGIKGYLTKPVKASQLFDCIALVLGLEAREDTTKAVTAVTQESVDSLRRNAEVIVLVVEDNLVNQKVAVSLLQRHGYRCEIAVNGREAVEALKRQPYDLVLMDCQMPEMDGFEATAAIREMEEGTDRHTVIVAMTANAMQEDAERCRQAGMDDYLPKPVRPERLYKAIESWVSNPPTADGKRATNKKIVRS
jgi:signal transduction histidine kinase/DNA-binding response OmpR family regulator